MYDSNRTNRNIVSKIHIALNLKLQIDKINHPLCIKKQVELSLLRLDLIDYYWGGNKYFKLKYNLEEAKRQGKKTLLSFGGAYSNHIAATAAAGKAANFSTIGIIRGEAHTPLNPTLAFASSCGMQLHYVSRENYRTKTDAAFLNTLKNEFGDYYLIPEGGSNLLAVKGCSEILEGITDFDTVCCACGTGATMAGIILSLSKNQTAIGFASLKGASFLTQDIQNFILEYKQLYEREQLASVSWDLNTRYDFGGYAKTNSDLISFAQNFERQQGIALDYVYTSKMMYGIFDLIEKNHFPTHTKILAVHSGGVQGNAGFEY
ncbi:MAG: 1-aminocyclopropane-1-carboxylate deaminase/D-cysteine desulfhydrase [Bacteroidetes bacterium]|nr:1-aminocyclopropane-1-carboxylate deaminase/D-cysteine desulfhydrase [Bacteroidota bacterium]